MAKRGRPSKYTEALADEICEWISEGKTLREFCRQDGKPSKTRVYAWLEQNDTFSGRFARAREIGFDVLAEECLEIADDGTNDYVERQNPKTGATHTEFDAEHVQRSRTRIDTRLKLLAKWDPKRYGDRQHVEHSGKVDVSAAWEAAKRAREKRLSDG